VSVRDAGTGPPDAAELRASDELLGRLGRRAPEPGDLDDPLIGALAVLACDVDLFPVPVSVSRGALAEAGAWPPAPAQEDCARLGYRPGGPARVAVPAPVSRHRPAVRKGPGGGPGPGRARVARRLPDRPPSLDAPRVLSIRPAMGVAAATALVLLGCVVAASVTGPVLDPVGDARTIVAEWNGHPAQRPALTAILHRVGDARAALREGDPAMARAILDEVAGQLPRLPLDDRRVAARQLSAVRTELGTVSGSALTGGAPRSTSPDAGAPQKSARSRDATASASGGIPRQETETSGQGTSEQASSGQASSGRASSGRANGVSAAASSHGMARLSALPDPAPTNLVVSPALTPAGTAETTPAAAAEGPAATTEAPPAGRAGAPAGAPVTHQDAGKSSSRADWLSTVGNAAASPETVPGPR
jgi:hypothetical protein